MGADSCHVSTHTTSGSVQVKDLSREGIIEVVNALKFNLDGTAEIKRVTLVRNELNYRQWEPKAKQFALSYTDDAPFAGENRYHLHVEQSDGNMAWSSPMWVKVTP